MSDTSASERSGGSRGGSSLRAILVVVLVVGGFAGAMVLVFRGCASYLVSESGTVRQFLAAVVASDGPRACGLLTEPARIALARQEKADACEDAVTRIAGSLSAGRRAELTDGFAVNAVVSGDGRKEIEVTGSAVEAVFGSGNFAVEFVDGHERIAEWGPQARRMY
ncbi:hypothetical protein [Actinosynnema sp. NPDC020468]|uniref:hypothetical protein n=1 Tax=Actinosynnema sp. NPDC020468 TaxID=3154488 RepID=UPI0033CBCF00